MITELSADSMLISGELNPACKYHPHRIPKFSMIKSIFYSWTMIDTSSLLLLLAKSCYHWMNVHGTTLINH